MSSTPTLKVAIAGGQGAIGTSIITGLLRSTTTTFDITVLTRRKPPSTPVPSQLLPHSLSWVEVDYSSPAELVTIFTGIDVVISAVHQTHAVHLDPILLEAAITAGVPRFFPCDYDCDRSYPHVRETAGDVYKVHFEFVERLEQVAREGRISWTVVMPSEFLNYDALPWLGFEVESREATLYDGGRYQATGCTPDFFGECFAVIVADERTQNRRVAVAEVAYTGLEMLRGLENVMGEQWKVVEDVSSEESTRRADNAFASGDVRKAYLTHVLRLNYDGVGPANLEEGLKFMEGRLRRRSLEEIVRDVVLIHRQKPQTKAAV